MSLTDQHEASMHAFYRQVGMALGVLVAVIEVEGQALNQPSWTISQYLASTSCWCS